MIAVVGGGASGALAALHLARTRSTRSRVLVIEPGAELGRGVAYRDSGSDHLLNVRTGALSAFEEDPGHFTRWCQSNKDGATDPLAFVPRAWFGAYLASMVRSVEHVPAAVVDVAPRLGRATIELSNGARMGVDRVVLAPGASPPVWPTRFGHGGPRWVPDPWAPDALRGLPGDQPVLLLGTGLTAVDIALDLQRSGHERVVATSRHGMLPMAHPEVPLAAVSLPPPPEPTARALVAWARASASEVGDWRSVIDALRGQTDQLWGALPPAERGRLLRHVRRHFEVVRHRMAPAVHTRIEVMREQGRLVVRPGTITGYDVVHGGFDVTISGRRERVGSIVNCTGPPPDVRRTHDPLIRTLLARGVVEPGPLQLGLRTCSDGSVPGSDGALWVVGSLRRGQCWETTAIPDIRAQTLALARALERRQPALSA